MSDSAPVITLSVDIGSTRTRVAAVDVNKLQCVDRIDSDNNNFDCAFVANIEKIAGAYPQIRRVNITSCVRNIAAKAKDICIDLSVNSGEKRFDTVELICSHTKLPVVFKYDDPNTLGADRVCNALACAALFKGKSCIIIDAGTAITVDCLPDGKVFEGGAILPGCAMQFWALHAKTDALPLFDIETDIDTPGHTLPSVSTAECIASGVLYGTAGAVDRCVDECLRICNGNNNVSIIATGGGWGLIEPLVKHEITVIPNLTLTGAGIYR
ncbi:MAG: type III pantothenate kinase [Chitinispirillales bacterium]|nr:type III pantothenate kinase [Chitinispirillales bacterium]